MYTRILVPTDGSRLARAALPHAAYLAQSTGASVTLVAVLPGSTAAAVAHVLVPVGLPDDAEQMRGAIEEAAAQLRSEGAADVDTLTVEGDPASKIVEAAQELRADLIVMGTHGRSEATRLLLGSVAEAVFKHAPCPVLFVGDRH